MPGRRQPRSAIGPVRVLRKTAAHDGVKRGRRQRLREETDGGSWPRTPSGRGARAVAVERAPSGQHLEEDRAEREESLRASTSPPSNCSGAM